LRVHGLLQITMDGRLQHTTHINITTNIDTEEK